MFISKKKLKKYIEEIVIENRAKCLGQSYKDPILEEQQKKNIYAQGYEDGTDNFYNALCGKFNIKRYYQKF